MEPALAVTLTKSPKPKPDPSTLVFGRVMTDHMFVMDYEAGKGWHSPRIEPYGPVSVEPALMVFHYGQALFEGLKAYRAADGSIKLFRPADNMRRLNNSARRLCIPEVDVDAVVAHLKRLIEVERDWVPSAPGTSLYIRPFIIATESALGVHPSHSYKFFIILCPVGPYYAEGFNPVKIWVETKYTRAAVGGTGEAKVAGNYAASILAAEEAKKKGYTQVLWLDGAERKYIEEVGTMNIFFKIDGKLVTPALSGTILPGITRDSVIKLARHWGMDVEERRITIDELFGLHHAGKLQEVFGTGTAAVISPVSVLDRAGEIITVGNGAAGPFALKLFESLMAIQYGKADDPFHWVVTAA